MIGVSKTFGGSSILSSPVRKALSFQGFIFLCHISCHIISFLFPSVRIFFPLYFSICILRWNSRLNFEQVNLFLRLRSDKETRRSWFHLLQYSICKGEITIRAFCLFLSISEFPLLSSFPPGNLLPVILTAHYFHSRLWKAGICNIMVSDIWRKWKWGEKTQNDQWGGHMWKYMQDCSGHRVGGYKF